MKTEADGKFMRVVTFAGIGVINTALDLACFSLLYYIFNTHLMLAHVCGFLLAVVSSYRLNTRHTFKDRIEQNKHAGKFSHFFVISFVTLLLSSVSLLLLSFYVHEFTAKVLTVFVSFSFNYLMLNRWLYRG